MFSSNTSPFLVGNASKNTFTLSKLLSGTSKTLNFINQAIPVYYNTKPIVKNASTLIKAFKKTTEPVAKDFKENLFNKETTNTKKDEEIIYSSLTFFQ